MPIESRRVSACHASGAKESIYMRNRCSTRCKNCLMARDNFTKGDIERLRLRVAHRCSNPDCRVPTVAPGSLSDAVTSIGVAAHVHAASPGGPRYVLEMSRQTRSSIDNAIWLCSGCSIKIDRDVVEYSAETLREWKASAEDQARRDARRASARRLLKTVMSKRSVSSLRSSRTWNMSDKSVSPW